MYIFEFTIFWVHIAPSYYWLMYLLGFLAWFYIIKKRIEFAFKTKNWGKIQEKKAKELLDDLLIYLVLGVILWWRIWYILFYNFSWYLENPLNILKIWEWGMSFHWWLIWVALALFLFSKKNKVNFYSLADHIALVAPIWIGLGRIWNYLNKELLGFYPYYWPFNVDWRFPSPLLEMFLEWVVLFIILNWVYRNKKLATGQIASLFLILYWVFRIFVEVFFRTPDEHIWYIWGYFTLWGIYSFFMVIVGVYFYRRVLRV